jgi:6-phosphogluconate dehydrogenase
MMEKEDLGFIGLAVMGQNLVLNLERNGCRLAVFNRNQAVTAAFTAKNAGKRIFPAASLEDLVLRLTKPRKIMLMVKAGAAVDDLITQLLPCLEAGDLIIDGGNSHFKDTERRFYDLEARGIGYLGMGVSGGEEGALWGPSIMPGGTEEAYAQVAPLLQAVAAKVEGDPCVTLVGPRGAGHFAKMVHNAIEYGDMQLIAEAYDLLKRGLGLAAKEMGEIFSAWNEGPLSSYLIEITAKILDVTDEDTQKPLVDLILDEAGQKGTGRWTLETALEAAVPIPTIAAAIDSRNLSVRRGERTAAARLFGGPPRPIRGNKETLVSKIAQALYVAKICSYAQGMALLTQVSEEQGYGIKASRLAEIWRGGCIIRARFLGHIAQAYRDEPALPSLLAAPFFREALAGGQEALREIVALAATSGIPLAGMSSSLAYFDSYRTSPLPTNLIQAQRDYFGAHTYARIDREGLFHTRWSDKT